MEDTTVRDDPAPPPPPPPPPPRRLLRRTEDGKVGGVCAGIADYLGLDVTVVRIAAVLLAFAGPGVPAYLVSWVVMPAAPAGTPPNPVRHGPVLGDGNGAVAGVALLLFATFIAFDGGIFDREVLLPALLIGGGVWLLVRDQGTPSDLGRPAGGAGDATSVAGAPPAGGPVPGGSSVGGPFGGEPGGAVAGSGAAALAPWRGGGATGGGGGPTASARAVPGGVGGVPAGRPASNRLGVIVLGLLALGGAAAWLLTAADVIDPDVGEVLAVVLVAMGIGLLVGAWWGRARVLVLPGVLVALALTAVTALDVPLEGGAGERRYRPVAVSEVREEYRLGTGQLELDLAGLDLDGERVELAASVGAGQLEVSVPEGATVELRGRITIGQLVLPGERSDDARGGVEVDERHTLPGDPGGGTVVLDLQVGLGQVEVSRG